MERLLRPRFSEERGVLCSNDLFVGAGKKETANDLQAVNFFNFELRNLQITNYHGGRASLDARLTGQGWAFMETPQGSFVIGTEQPIGTVMKRTDTKHRSLPAGRSGDKMVYEVHVKGGMVHQYNYTYEWTE